MLVKTETSFWYVRIKIKHSSFDFPFESPNTRRFSVYVCTVEYYLIVDLGGENNESVFQQNRNTVFFEIIL